MFIKKPPNKDVFDDSGYAILDTTLSDYPEFNKIVQEIYTELDVELKKSKLKEYGGYIMGNFGINQGQYGPKLYSIIFQQDFIDVFETLTNNKLDFFSIKYGGNLTLPKKGAQHFHLDGEFKKEMYLVSIATENIDLSNAPTEICVGSHLKPLKFWKFFINKKIKKKLLLKKGQILIRKHNLWHRGTKNLSNKARLLLSFVITPKAKNNQVDLMSTNLKILPNFFKSDLKGRLHEIMYVHFRTLHTILKLIYSFFKKNY